MMSNTAAAAGRRPAMRVEVRCDRQEQRRHHERRPGLLARVEQRFASAMPDDEHQQAGIGRASDRACCGR